jgi:S1-C subfamily serine protease
MRVEPAHAKFGLGFYYEAQPDGVYVTRVASNSPASRAGIAEGDTITELMGKPVSSMKSGEAQSSINTHRRDGLKVVVRSAGGKTHKAELKDGPVYLVSGKDAGFGD